MSGPIMRTGAAAAVFSQDTDLGSITIEPFDPAAGAGLVHGWVIHPRAAFWQMQDATREQVRAAYAAVDSDPHHDAWLGRLDGTPLFLAETYDPAHGELRSHYEVVPGDVGMHLLVAPPGTPRHGLTSTVMRAVMTFVFSDDRCRRVVVEPDERNDRIAAKNAEAGFVVSRRIRLPGKVANLSFCTRTDFAASALGTDPSSGDAVPGTTAAEHLNPPAMAHAHRGLVAKALSEFAHERLIEPCPDGDGYVLVTGGGSATYRFRANRYALEHWAIDPASITRQVAGRNVALDALELILDLRDALEIPEALLGTYLEEISATLAGTAYKHDSERLTSADLVHADFQTIEAAMTEGHPAFVANNGRIGFGLADHREYAPETGRPVRLVWLAVRREHARLSCGRGVDEDALYEGQLGEQQAAFSARLRGLGLDPADYLYLPVHPWQWENKLTVTFAADIARRDLVPVGTSTDRFRPQQSIRTFFDLNRPERHYVKTALAIQNMGFVRGLSPGYMSATPAINDWVSDLLAGDETLRECGFGLLQEVAAIGYTGSAYHRAGPRSPYQRMVAALWRESPVPSLDDGERLATMASLLHRDWDGHPFVSELVAAAPVDAREWVRHYLRAYLRPILHCLLRHDLAFMPHGENVILVLTDHVPRRILVKDIGEEVAVQSDRELPPEAERIRALVDDEFALLPVFTDVFDGFFRYLAAILDADGILAADTFWALVAECIGDHAREHPELHRGRDLFARAFPHSCLNRLQLRNTRQMVDLTNQGGSLIFAGTLDNPIARWAPE